MDKYNENTKIWVLSDLHLGHDKEFIWKKRGFNSVQEMDETIIQNIKAKVKDNDIFYICGDVVLGNENLDLLKQIPGQVHIILGNHDTDRRIEIYKSLSWKCSFAERIKYKNQSIFLSHYPTLTSNPGDSWQQAVINISGHTHLNLKWIESTPFIYNVSCEANNCSPVLIDDIIEYIKIKNHK